MKKICLLAALCALFLNGCEQSQRPSSDFSEGIEPDAKEPEQPQFQAESSSLPKDESSDTYYKLETAPAVFDEGAILKYLIPGYDESMVQQVDVDGSKEYSVEVDGVTHTWYIGEGNFHYINSLALGGELTEAEALAQSDAFVRHQGFDVAENPSIYDWGDGEYLVEYGLLYEGVPILGEGGIYMKDDDDFINASYIQIYVNGSGIHSVSLCDLLECAEVLEEYQREEDLLSPSKLDAIISMAQKVQEERWAEGGDECHIKVTEIQLLYIPYEEKGKRILMPAFRVMGLSLMDGESEESGEVGMELWLIDAVTGRVIVG